MYNMIAAKNTLHSSCNTYPFLEYVLVNDYFCAYIHASVIKPVG